MSENTDSIGSGELFAHQLLVAIGVVSIPLIGIVHRFTAPDEFDPLRYRLIFSVLGVGLLIAERFFERARRHHTLLVLLFGGSVMAWFSWLTAINGFSQDRVIGLFIIQFSGATILWRVRHQIIIHALVITLTINALGAAETVDTSPGMLITAQVALAIFSIFHAWSRQRVTCELDHSRAALESAYNEVEQRVIDRTAELSHEIAERRTAEARAEQGSLAKSQFLANMSHELRTPLNAIIGYSEMLRENVSDASEEAQDLDHVLGAANHLQVMINDILDLARIEAGQMELQLHPVDLGGLVTEVGETIKPLVATNRNQLEIRMPATLPRVSGDPDRLKQILLNLTSNAAKFTSDGTITIEASADDAQVHLSVRDTGMGIPQDKLALLFKRFSQVDGSSTRRHGGTGLGLAISRDLVQLHGGQIDVESTCGVGSVFTVHLPYGRVAASNPTGDQSAAASA